MKRRTLETIVKVAGFGGTALALIVYAGLSWFSPKKSLEEVAAREFNYNGTPQRVISNYKKTTTSYTTGLFYQSNTADFSEQNRPKEFFPTEVYRQEYDAKERRAKDNVMRKGQKQENPLMKADEKYTVQFNCPQNMKAIRVVYNGIQRDITLFKPNEESNFLVAKANFSPIEGKAYLKAEVVYFNGEKDAFEIPIIGQ